MSGRITLTQDQALDLFYFALCEIRRGDMHTVGQMESVASMAKKLDFQLGGDGCQRDLVEAEWTWQRP